MPDENLIAALDRLRETYNQRQRSTNNLLNALKGTISALSKTNRSLRDYADQNPDGNGLGQTLQAFSTLRVKDEAIDPVMPQLKRDAKQFSTLDTALKDALAALRAESVDVIKLGRARSALQSSRVRDAGLGEVLPQIDYELEQAQRALGDTFGVALRDAFAQQGIELGGRPPRFEIGRFELVADFVSRTGSLSYGKNLLTKRVPLSVEAVLRTYEREAKAIMGRNEDGPRWMEQLYNAWETVRRKRLISEPRVSIVECFLELALLRQSRAFRSAPTKNGFVEYTRAQFAYDFYKFTSETPVLHNGLRAFGLVATKSQADNAERSIWIVEGDNPHAGRYIADVKFDKDE